GDLAGQEGQFLTQVEPAAQLDNGPLAIADLSGTDGSKEPAGQGVLAGAGARSGQALEQAADAEEVKVRCGGVVGLQVAETGLTRPGPAILDTRQSLLVEARQPLSFPHRSGNVHAAP